MADGYGTDGPQVAAAEMKKKDLVDDLMVLNSLAYSLPSSLSAAVSRVNKVSYADKTNYSNNDSEIVIRIVSSSDYIKMCSSYLTFDFSVTSVTDMSVAVPNNAILNLVFGAGGALSLFQRLVIESKNGTNLIYKDRFSQIATQLLYANNPAGYILDMADCARMLVNSNGEPFSYMSGYTGAQNTATISGAPATTNYPRVSPSTAGVAATAGDELLNNMPSVSLANAANSAVFTLTTNAAPFKVLIPLAWLDGLFDTPCLTPSNLAAGLRIRLSLQGNANAFTLVNSGIVEVPVTSGLGANGVGTIGYSITNPQVVLDCYQLSPQIYSRLQDMSASQGLDVTFKTQWYQSTNVNNNTSINVEINKSVSRALAVYMCTTQTLGSGGTTLNTNYIFDPNQTLAASVKQYSSRLGALVFPSPAALQIITAPNNTIQGIKVNSMEFYHLFLIAMKKSLPQGSKYGPSAVRYKDFVAGFNMLSQTLERSSIDMSGIPVNNARSFSAQLVFAVPLTTQINSYMEFVSVAKVFLKETVLKL